MRRFSVHSRGQRFRGTLIQRPEIQRNSNSVGDVFIAYREFFVQRVCLDSMVMAQFGRLLLYAQCTGVELFSHFWMLIMTKTAWSMMETGVWEVRHGSVMALREIFTQQGAFAGVFMPDLSWDGAVFVDVEDKDGLQPNLRRSKFEDVSSSTQWPILSLTVRFGDYVSDQVVAPVRETCAQALEPANYESCEADLFHYYPAKIDVQSLSRKSYVEDLLQPKLDIVAVHFEKEVEVVEWPRDKILANQQQ
nr:tata-binding protein-associated factor mot1 [Quercus suber]